jgi:hypothetical protein
MHGLNVAVFIIGWLLFVALQIQNSVRSSSNGLQGTAGWLAWLKLHAIELMLRAFVSALLYGYIVNQVQEKIAAVGFSLTSTSIAGFGGLAANSLLYQFFGLIPWLRVEVGELAPPAPTAAPSVGRIGAPPGA